MIWIVRISGVIVILLAAVALSVDRRAIRARSALSALAVQFAIGFLTLYTPAGRTIVLSLAHGVEALMGYSRAGIDLVFGGLANPSVAAGLAITMLPVIIFFAALASILDYLRIIPVLVNIIGGLLGRILKVGRVEALCAAANIFVGQSESPLVIRGYLANLPPAAVFTIMTSGMAGVAGTVLAAYAQIGIRLDYLLVASFMAAPAGLLMAKIVFPDDPAMTAEAARTPISSKRRSSNLIMAATDGTQDGVRIAVGVGSMLLSFVALVALANGLLALVGSWFGLSGLTFQGLLGKAISPALYLLGIPWPETGRAGALLSERLILNEFVAYIHLAGLGEVLSAHTRAVMTFALCGFANIGSIGIQMAVIGGLAPEHRGFVAKYGPRALGAATLANLMSAAIAGMLIA